VDGTPHSEESFFTGTQFKKIPDTPPLDASYLDANPRSIELPQSARLISLSRRPRRRFTLVLLLSLGIILSVSAIILVPLLKMRLTASRPALDPQSIVIFRPTLIPTPPFDPNQGAVLPTHRVVAFYAIPYAEPTGPAYEPTDAMLAALKKQGAAYAQLDPAHPVQLGIDLVVSVPDAYPGPQGTYSHHVNAGTIQTYIDFCNKNHLVLFLDLNFGLSPVMKEVNFFLPYLERYSFVHMAVDPEWMFPRRDGIPGVNLSNVRASDLNPIIEAIAAIPTKYHVPRKMLIIHQYRPDGDGLKNPYDAGQAEIADKRDLIFDPRVDVVIHIDSVGGYPGDIRDKTFQYTEWVQQDMKKYHNFLYGGFKLFYQHESKVRLMTPKEVLSLNPPPMVVTYGN
jgi:hypothetical protein